MFEHKYTRSTPKAQDKVYLRVLNPEFHGPGTGAVPSERMETDIRKFLVNIKAIFDAKGVAVQGLGTRRYGHRSAAEAGGNWGASARPAPEGPSCATAA